MVHLKDGKIAIVDKSLANNLLDPLDAIKMTATVSKMMTDLFIVQFLLDSEEISGKCVVLHSIAWPVFIPRINFSRMKNMFRISAMFEVNMFSSKF